MAGMLDQRGKITPESLEAKMHLDKKMRVQLDRIVTAGLKVMFSPQSHQLMLKQMDGPQPIAQKIGEGVAGLMSMLFQESNRSISPKLLIPAGTILCAHAALWLRKVGQTVTDQDIGNAIEAMTTAILHAVGIDPDKLSQIAASGKMPSRTAPAATETMPPTAAATAPAPAQGAQA